MDLGLSSREFWEMTPRQFSLLVDRHNERLRTEAALHGVKVDMPSKSNGMGPEVFEDFRRAFGV